MPYPLNLANASRPVAGLPQYTASSPTTCYPSPKYSDPPSPVQKPTQKPSSQKPARIIAPQYVHDLFSPQTWAKDGFQLYPDEVEATVAEFRNSVVCGKYFEDHFAASGPSEARIEEFLKKTELYDSYTERWQDIPEVCTDMRRELFRPMRVLVDAITEHFGYVTTRPVVDSFSIPENCLEVGQPHRKPNSEYRETSLKKIPHMMALGVSGSNFGPLPSVFESGPSYAACISPVELQIENERDSTSDLIQLALYARQCFMRQHNRRFVYALLITERNATLYMFDRSGACHSHPVDIHTRAADFVRLLLGVWAPNDAAVGFDTTISWDQDARGAWRRHITSLDELNTSYRYVLTDPTPIYNRWFIEGRGTTCWAATDAHGEGVLIKDLWRDTGKYPERRFLKKASEMLGVGQMVSGQEGVRVSVLRDMAQRPGFVDRQFSRLVLKDYGSSNISRFKGHKDLLHGFRDAIAGHQRLFDAGILHGDVNMENILLTSQFAPPGGRSALIDLDLAMWLKGHDNHSAPRFHNQGTRAYMSLNVLESHHTPRAGFARDHLDDLESFYYLLLHICATFTGPGERLAKPDFVKAWEQPDTGAAAHAKMGSLLGADADAEPTAYFGGATGTFGVLLEKLRGFVAGAAGRKRRDAARREGAKSPARATLWRKLKGEAALDYEAVLRLVDDALYEVQIGRWMVVEDADVEAAYRKRVLALADALPLPVGVGSAAAAGAASGCMCGRKRGREEEEEEEDEGVKEESPEPKRLRMYPPVTGMLF